MNIAVTGGMGAGKSTVTKIVAERLGIISVSADDLCHTLLDVGMPGYLQMRNVFSDEFFLKDGSIKKPFLRRVIFSDKNQRDKLDAILHPLVRKKILMLGETAKAKAIDFVAEVPLLFEKRWQGDFDATLAVFADSETCVTRIMNRDMVTRKEAERSLASQMSQEEKCKLADWIIDNSGSLTATRKQIHSLIKSLDSFLGKS